MHTIRYTSSIPNSHHKDNKSNNLIKLTFENIQLGTGYSDRRRAYGGPLCGAGIVSPTRATSSDARGYGHSMPSLAARCVAPERLLVSGRGASRKLDILTHTCPAPAARLLLADVERLGLELLVGLPNALSPSDISVRLSAVVST